MHSLHGIRGAERDSELVGILDVWTKRSSHWKRRLYRMHRGHDDEHDEAKNSSRFMHASDAHVPRRIAGDQLDFPPNSAWTSPELRVFTGTVQTSSPISRGTKPEPASLVDT
jgi:hypothetical protein